MWARLLVFVSSAQLVIDSCSALSEFQHLGAVDTLRQERSLLNTFPFTQAQLLESSSVREVKQRDEVSVDFNSVASSERCIDKIEMVEETEYDEVVQCDHSYDKRCTTSYTTTYEAQQEEECEENFRKNCFIEYSQTAQDVTVEICRATLIKDCEAEGPEVCSTEYESECETVQHPHDVEDDVVECRTEVEEKCEDETSGYTTNTKCSQWPREVCDVSKKSVTKYTPDTQCSKIPVELCGPASCPLVAGPEECYEKVVTIAGEKPEEVCNLEPQTSCKHVTKLVPQLKPHESCVDVPKEVCTRSRTNPRKVKKPVIKKWCYNASPESGLEPVSVSDSAAQPAEECPAQCARSVASGQCDPECEQWEYLCGPCVPKCPDRCAQAVRSGQCDPSCTPYNDICGQCIPPPPPPTCPPRCSAAIASGDCDPSCDQYADLCGPCIPTCPRKCEDAIRTGNCDPSCNAYIDVCGECLPAYVPPPTTTPPPPRPTPPPPQCPAKCRDAVRTGQCDPSCRQYEAMCGPCVQTCPAKCKEAIRFGQCDPACDAYEDVCGPCVPPPPPSPPPAEYLPPPGQDNQPSYGRSYSPAANTNSFALPPRSQFARQFQSRSNTAPSSRSRPVRPRPSSAARTRNQRQFSPVQDPLRPAAPKSNNNWDLFFKTGIIARKG